MDGFNPGLLKLAREAKGWPQTRLSEESGVAQGTISKYEKGLMEPTHGQLEALADALVLPMEFFMDVAARPAAVLYRSRSLRSARREGLVRARLNLARLVAGRLLEGVAVEGTTRFPEPDQTFGEPEAAADFLRSAWWIASGPIENICDYLELAGGVVVRADLGSDEVAAAYLHPLGDPVRWFFVNTRVIAGDRVRFSLAHELGHAVLHDATMIPDTKEAESGSNRFAGAFLVPERDLAAELPRTKLRLEHLVDLKRRWGVSMQTIAVQAHRIGAISRHDLSRLFREMSVRGYRTHEPVDIVVEKPQIISEALRIHRDEHGFSEEDLAKVAKVEVSTLIDLFPEHFRQPRGRLRVVAEGGHRDAVRAIGRAH